MAVTSKVASVTGRRSRNGRGEGAPAGRARLLSVAVAIAALVAGCTGAPASDDTPVGPATGSPGGSPVVASEPTLAPSTPAPTAVPTAATAAPGEEPSPSADAEMAAAMCEWLVAAHTELGAVANQAVVGISAAAPAERMESIMAGYAAAIAVAEGFPAALQDQDFPDVPERDRLVEEVTAGAVEAGDELDDERDAFAEHGSEVADEDVFGGVGQFFNGFEKAMSSLEPSLAMDARPELQAAFLQEESCQFVIQPFPLAD